MHLPAVTCLGLLVPALAAAQPARPLVPTVGLVTRTPLVAERLGPEVLRIMLGLQHATVHDVTSRYDAEAAALAAEVDFLVLVGAAVTEDTFGQPCAAEEPDCRGHIQVETTVTVLQAQQPGWHTVASLQDAAQEEQPAGYPQDSVLKQLLWHILFGEPRESALDSALLRTFANLRLGVRGVAGLGLTARWRKSPDDAPPRLPWSWETGLEPRTIFRLQVGDRDAGLVITDAVAMGGASTSLWVRGPDLADGTEGELHEVPLLGRELELGAWAGQAAAGRRALTAPLQRLELALPGLAVRHWWRVDVLGVWPFWWGVGGHGQVKSQRDGTGYLVGVSADVEGRYLVHGRWQLLAGGSGLVGWSRLGRGGSRDWRGLGWHLGTELLLDPALRLRLTGGYRHLPAGSGPTPYALGGAFVGLSLVLVR